MKQDFGGLKLSKKQESGICLSCGECCKRYFITVLPNEAQKISRVLKKSRSAFLTSDCELNVKLYPKSTLGVLTFPSAFLPKRIFDLVRREAPNIPESFFVVPQVVLKREEKITFKFNKGKAQKEKRNACFFLKPENECSIYDARPEPCRLFPFIAMPDFREQYPFCELFQKTSKDNSAESKIYFRKVQDYFKSIDDEGFYKIWLTPPKEGRIFLGDKEIGSISIEELIQMMPKK